MIVILSNPLVLARNFEPVLPEVTLLIAMLVKDILDRAGLVASRRAAIVTLVGAALLAEPLRSSILWVSRLRVPDTRQLAADWIASNVPVGAGIAVYGGAPDAVDWGVPVECRAGPSIAPDVVAINCASRTVALHSRLPRAHWSAHNVTFVYWYYYPLPFSHEPLPSEASGGRLLATFDPFASPRRETIVEPYDAFYFPLDCIDAVTRPGPLIRIYAVQADAHGAP